MKPILRIGILSLLVASFVGTKGAADTTPITAGLNAPVIGSNGGAQVFWGPIVSQSSLDIGGQANTLYPQKFAGTSFSRNGGSAGSASYCQTPGTPDRGPGTIVPPSSVPVYEWYCNFPSPPAPQVS